MENIKIEQSGKYAHKATFTDAFGDVRTVYSLNGEKSVLKAAKNRIKETKISGRNFVKVSNFQSFINKLFRRRKTNKLEAISRKKNRN